MSTKSSVPLKDTISWAPFRILPFLRASVLSAILNQRQEGVFSPPEYRSPPSFHFKYGMCWVNMCTPGHFQTLLCFLIKLLTLKTCTHHTTVLSFICIPIQIFLQSVSLLPLMFSVTATSCLFLNAWQCMHVTQCYYCLRLASCHLVCLLLLSFDSMIRTNCESARCISSQKNKSRQLVFFPLSFRTAHIKGVPLPFFMKLSLLNQRWSKQTANPTSLCLKSSMKWI